MEDLHISQQLGCLVLMLASAKVCGELARLAKQPAVLGELLAGVILGGSLLGLVDPENAIFRLLAEIGVILLLFHIGLETDLKKLFQVGGASLVVAITGVVLPFVFGYFICRLLGLANLVGIVVGASLTATSIGITARILSDLGRLQETEGQTILAAAVIDDIIGLAILAVVTGLNEGKEVSFAGVASVAALAVGFLLAALLLGWWGVPALFRRLQGRIAPEKIPAIAVVFAIGMAILAERAGSQLILGAFAAGLLVARTPQAREIERGIASLGHFFVPVFFVMVGAAVDLRTFNPLHGENHQTLLVAGLLLLAAVAGKFLSGYSPFWHAGRKSVIGAGMIPRGEVGLIFAQMGQSTGVLDPAMFSAVTLVVIATTFMTPPLLRAMFCGREKPPSKRAEPVEDLVNDP